MSVVTEAASSVGFSLSLIENKERESKRWHKRGLDREVRKGTVSGDIDSPQISRVALV